jgi:hypothetical protein
MHGERILGELAVSAIVYACVLGGALFGIYLHRVLPGDHVDERTRQTINVAVGLIATLSALVLGLLVASAKGSFDGRSDEVKQSATRIVLLDRNLRQYGPEAKPARDLLRQLTQRRIDRTWMQLAGTAAAAEELEASGLEELQARLWALAPRDDTQKWRQMRALALTTELEKARWMLFEQTGSSIPTPFMVVLVLWLTVIFTSLGLFAPRNRTVYGVTLVCALSVATAIFLIMEMDQPFEGVLQISDAPLRKAMTELVR